MHKAFKACTAVLLALVMGSGYDGQPGQRRTGSRRPQ
mgnify:CR=1 FL=1